MAEVDRIERDVVVKAAPDRVWAALTTARGLAGWFGDVAEIDLRPGGTARFGWTRLGQTVHAVVDAVDPPHRFAFRWALQPDTPVDAGPTTHVAFTLLPVAGGTRIRVVETGFAALPDDIRTHHFDENTAGWQSELADLVAYLQDPPAA